MTGLILHQNHLIANYAIAGSCECLCYSLSSSPRNVPNTTLETAYTSDDPMPQLEADSEGDIYDGLTLEDM